MTTRTPGANPRTVLIVDDSGYARTRLRRFMGERGFAAIVEASDGDEALRLFDRHRPSVVLLDHVMRGREGTETARLMLAQDPSVQIIMLTAVTDRGLKDKALNIGIRKVLEKMDFETLGSTLSELGYE